MELPYLFKDNSYDFNYQETRRLSEEREIFPGDSLQVVCDYKTKDAKENMTVVRYKNSLLIIGGVNRTSAIETG